MKRIGCLWRVFALVLLIGLPLYAGSVIYRVGLPDLTLDDVTNKILAAGEQVQDDFGIKRSPRTNQEQQAPPKEDAKVAGSSEPTDFKTLLAFVPDATSYAAWGDVSRLLSSPLGEKYLAPQLKDLLQNKDFRQPFGLDAGTDPPITRIDQVLFAGGGQAGSDNMTFALHGEFNKESFRNWAKEHNQEQFIKDESSGRKLSYYGPSLNSKRKRETFFALINERVLLYATVEQTIQEGLRRSIGQARPSLNSIMKAAVDEMKSGADAWVIFTALALDGSSSNKRDTESENKLNWVRGELEVKDGMALDLSVSLKDPNNGKAFVKGFKPTIKNVLLSLPKELAALRRLGDTVDAARIRLRGKRVEVFWEVPDRTARQVLDELIPPAKKKD